MEIETDSTDEAVEIYRQLSGGKEHTSAHNPTPKRRIDAGADQPKGVALGDYARKMLKVLIANPSGGTTEEIATLVGVNGPKGLASLTRQIREWAVQFDLDEEPVERERRPNENGGMDSYTRLSGALIQKIKGREKEFIG